MASGNEKQQRKLELVQQLNNQRSSLIGGRDVLQQQFANKSQSLKNAINVPKRIKASIQTDSKKWITGAIVTGLAASLLTRKSRKVKIQQQYQPYIKKRSLTSTLFINFAKPAIKGWIVKKVTQAAKDRIFQS